MEKKKLHSEEYFGDQRDFWWHRDFIQLMAKRWHLQKFKTILDVGSGQGHWGLTLFPLLNKDAVLTGIEPEAKWREIANQRARQFDLNNRVTYIDGVAESIPFPDNSFDMVTCQTVLIHVAEPIMALSEMKRVLKPDGLLVAVEPNNSVPLIILNNLIWKCSADDIAALIKFQIICERGKEALKEGNNMRGDLLPYYFSQIKVREISIYLSDMADFLIPPYNSAREKAVVQNYLESYEEELYVWSKEDTHRYFIGGGGTEDEFIKSWDLAKKQFEVHVKGMKENSLFLPGAAVFYLVSGRK